MIDLLLALWHVWLALIALFIDLVVIGWCVNLVDVRWRGWRHFGVRRRI